MTNNQIEMWDKAIEALEGFDDSNRSIEIVPSNDPRPWYKRIKDGEILGH